MTKQPTQTENCPVCGKPKSEHKDGLFCCPFCGSNDLDLESGDDSRWIFYRVACDCGAEVWEESKDKSKEAWNKRA